MDRVVTLVLVRSDGAVLGALPSFTVGTPWWPDVADVVEACRVIHGIHVTILRLLDAAPADPLGGMGGRVSYVAELDGAAPTATRPWTTSLPDDPLRARWARPGGPARDIAWADEQLRAAGRPRDRPAVQMKTWNLSSIWRLPTSGGDVWFKAVPPFFAHEGAVIHALAAPALPPLIAFDDLGRTLLEDVRGVDQYRAPTERHAVMIDALVALQAGGGRSGRSDPRRRCARLARGDIRRRGRGRRGARERRTRRQRTARSRTAGCGPR